MVDLPALRTDVVFPAVWRVCRASIPAAVYGRPIRCGQLSDRLAACLKTVMRRQTLPDLLNRVHCDGRRQPRSTRIHRAPARPLTRIGGRRDRVTSCSLRVAIGHPSAAVVAGRSRSRRFFPAGTIRAARRLCQLRARKFVEQAKVVLGEN